jgi:predicted transcriptional regulator
MNAYTTWLQVRLDTETKARLAKLASQNNSNLSKTIRFLIDREYETRIQTPTDQTK